jgi:hypothetical protein
VPIEEEEEEEEEEECIGIFSRPENTCCHIPQ